MNNQKRNRLIGLICLVLLALIFFPYLFNKKIDKEENTSIPLLANDTDIQPAEISELDGLISSIDVSAIRVGNDAEIIQPVDSSTGFIEESKQNSAPSTHFVNGHTIQLVALKNRQKIEELVALLRLNNYDVYTIPSKPSDGDLIRLYVGNYPTTEQASLTLIDLENLTKLKGFIMTKPKMDE